MGRSFRASTTPAILTLVKAADAGSDAAGVVAPADIQKGDFLIYGQQSVNAFSTPGETTPSGFMNAVSAGASNARAMIDYKIADGTEGGTTITGMDATFDWHTITVFRPSRPIKMVRVFDPAGYAGNGDPPEKIIDASASHRLCLAIAVYGAGFTETVVPSFTPTEDGTVTYNWEHVLKYKTFHGSPEDVTVDSTDVGDRNTLASCYFEFEFYDDLQADAFSLFTSANSSTGSVTVPSSVQHGDVLVLLDRATNSSGTPSASYDAGFEELATITGSSIRLSWSAKIADGTEGGTNLTGPDGNSSDQHVLLVFRGNRPAQRVTAFSPVSVAPTSGNPGAIQITDQSLDKARIHLAGYYSSGTVNPRTFGSTKDGEVANGTTLYGAYKALDIGEALTNASIDMDDEGNNNTLLAVGIEII